MKRFTRKRRLALAALLALVVAVAGGAFTATNTFGAGGAGAAGDGSAVISGFTISNVQYQLSTTNAANLASVTFNLAPAAGSAQVKVVSTATAFQNCVLTSGGTLATCTFATQPTVLAADQLRVIATS